MFGRGTPETIEDLGESLAEMGVVGGAVTDDALRCSFFHEGEGGMVTVVFRKTNTGLTACMVEQPVSDGAGLNWRLLHPGGGGGVFDEREAEVLAGMFCVSRLLFDWLYTPLLRRPRNVADTPIVIASDETKTFAIDPLANGAMADLLTEVLAIPVWRMRFSASDGFAERDDWPVGRG